MYGSKRPRRMETISSASQPCQALRDAAGDCFRCSPVATHREVRDAAVEGPPDSQKEFGAFKALVLRAADAEGAVGQSPVFEASEQSAGGGFQVADDPGAAHKGPVGLPQHRSAADRYDLAPRPHGQ